MMGVLSGNRGMGILILSRKGDVISWKAPSMWRRRYALRSMCS
jgi:hypothetical protein